MEHSFLSPDDREETLIERRERERLENGKVDNDETIPLIPNVKNDVRRTISAIEVYKADPPGDGFKGTIPANANLVFVAKLYGNGIYDFHAVTADGKVLRRNTGVKVSMAVPETKGEKPSPDSAPDMHLLRWQAEQNERDSKRVEAFGKMAVDMTKDASNNMIQSLTKQFEATVIRDREFMSGLITQQQNFFQNMMQQAEAAHQRSMERQREDTNHTVRLLQTSAENSRQNPNLLLQAFREGLALSSGDEDDDGDSSEPWVQAIQAASSAIEKVAEAKTNNIAVPKAAINAQPSQQNSPQQKAKQPQTKKKSSPFTKEELAEIVRMKNLMDQKGLDFAATVRNASKYFTGAGGSVAETAQESDPSESSSESGEESGEADMGDS